MPSQQATANGLEGLSVAAASPKRTTASPISTLPPADISSSSRASTTDKPAKSWTYMVAGAVGSLAAATATAPFDVIRTRLQSDFYQQQQRAARASAAAAAAASASGKASVAAANRNPVRAVGRHLSETMQIFAAVKRTEGWRALFKGLGPTLVGTVPAKSINFFTYGNGKRVIAEAAQVDADKTPWVQLAAGVVAGLVTSTATNPIWLVKTRMQLDKNSAALSQGAVARRYRNGWDCARQVVRDEGVRGLYKGMTASYLGAAESTLHWLLYEQMKRALERREHRLTASGSPRGGAWDRFVEWTGPLAGAGAAKLFASLLTYPHEVVRTRLRQAPLADGERKYTGLVQCFLRVWREEGVPGLYGGLTPHLLRTVPASGITFGIYEIVLKLLNAPDK